MVCRACSFFCTLFLSGVTLTLSTCFAQAPQIFYTDLLSGPATGGEAGQGAFVTLYGVGFGDTRGASTITIGGMQAAAYPIWSDKRITLQVGSTAHTGAVVAHVAGGGESNGMPFTIRPGHIYFVARNGNDSNSGSSRKPWKTLVTAKNTMQPGDITYAMDGVEQSTLDMYDSAFSIQTSGKAGAPLAIVAYPGARVTIGTFEGPRIAARTPNVDRSSDHWVLAGLTFQGAQEALDVTASEDWRIIDDDFSCPNGFGPTGCIETSQATFIAFLGNHVHDIARPGTTKAYHAVYFSTDSNNIEVGWNTISNVRGCRGLQFHSSPLDANTGFNQYNLSVHDNTIHDTVCDAINFATIDPSKGSVNAYNNIIYNAGTGPDPEDGGADYACIYVQGGANRGAPGAGIVDIYNNTMYNCGARRNTDSGAISLSSGSPLQQVRLSNNVILLRHGESLVSDNSTWRPLLSQTNILWFASGSSSLPHQQSGLHFMLRDPLLQDPDHGDFTLGKGSPAIATGTQCGLAFDIRGMRRPSTGKPDIGAWQHDAPLSGSVPARTLSGLSLGGARQALPPAGLQIARPLAPR